MVSKASKYLDMEAQVVGSDDESSSEDEEADINGNLAGFVVSDSDSDDTVGQSSESESGNHEVRRPRKKSEKQKEKTSSKTPIKDARKNKEVVSIQKKKPRNHKKKKEKVQRRQPLKKTPSSLSSLKLFKGSKKATIEHLLGLLEHEKKKNKRRTKKPVKSVVAQTLANTQAESPSEIQDIVRRNKKQTIVPIDNKEGDEDYSLADETVLDPFSDDFPATSDTYDDDMPDDEYAALFRDYNSPEKPDVTTQTVIDTPTGEATSSRPSITTHVDCIKIEDSDDDLVKKESAIKIEDFVDFEDVKQDVHKFGVQAALRRREQASVPLWDLKMSIANKLLQYDIDNALMSRARLRGRFHTVRVEEGEVERDKIRLAAGIRSHKEACQIRKRIRALLTSNKNSLEKAWL